MPDSTLSDQQLLAYLDESLPVDQMAGVEKALRKSEPLRRRAAGLAHRRDQGVHSIGEIWRRFRLSCPTRHQLGSFLLGTLPADFADYIEFHVRSVGCRNCAASLTDLEQAMQSSTETSQRRRRFFESSAGYLRKMSGRK